MTAITPGGCLGELRPSAMNPGQTMVTSKPAG
jgi:hypothetical protein